ncbi:MAG: MFS transporter [Dehalococcoidia bacterium]
MNRKYVIFGLVALALLMSSIDNTIVAVGLPAMRTGLHTSIVLIGWTITIYQLGQLLVLPLAGKLSDELGRKRIFLGSIAIFTGASFLCGIAPNVYLLIIFRLLQAIGGGAFLPSCTGIISDTFQEKRGQAIGLFSSIFPIGGVIGPNIGGILIDHLSWRFIFYVNVPIGIAVLILTAYLYHTKQETHGSSHIDFVGVALYGSGITTLLLDLTWLGQSPRGATHSPLLWLSMAGAAALFWLWYRHENRTAEPMVDMTLLKYRPFLAANGYNFLFGAGVFGFTAFLPTYAELHYHMSATLAGALLTPRAVIMICTSTIASFFLIRFGYRLPMILGVSFASLSLFLTSLGKENLVLLGLHISNFVYLGAVIAILGLGFGLSAPASNNAALDIMPGKVAAVTGIRGMFRQTGGILGTAMTVFVISLYRDESQGLQVVFFSLAIVLLLIIPVVFLIPDTARQRRRNVDHQAGQSDRTSAQDVSPHLNPLPNPPTPFPKQGRGSK